MGPNLVGDLDESIGEAAVIVGSGDPHCDPTLCGYAIVARSVGQPARGLVVARVDIDLDGNPP